MYKEEFRSDRTPVCMDMPCRRAVNMISCESGNRELNRREEKQYESLRKTDPLCEGMDN